MHRISKREQVWWAGLSLSDDDEDDGGGGGEPKQGMEGRGAGRGEGLQTKGVAVNADRRPQARKGGGHDYWGVQREIKKPQSRTQSASPRLS